MLLEIYLGCGLTLLSPQPTDWYDISPDFKKSPAGKDNSTTPKQNATWRRVLASGFSSLSLKILIYVETYTPFVPFTIFL